MYGHDLAITICVGAIATCVAALSLWFFGPLFRALF